MKIKWRLHDEVRIIFMPTLTCGKHVKSKFVLDLKIYKPFDLNKVSSIVFITIS